ncbi:hypothetical protein BKA69DRAFT_723924 [Paraphysoderma sedebokerense]|nr:hypothetical protein BKA69DRAFT_723924 [Paraphysoderma sedebokerense]
MVLWGDLILSKTCGINQSTKPSFVTDDTICYASGNLIVFKQIYESQIVSESFFQAGSFITALIANSLENVVAFAERGSSVVKIIKYPSKKELCTLSQTAIQDVGILALSFSFTGQYLITLGDLPNHGVTLWDWNAQTLLAYKNYGYPAISISFNPFNDEQICLGGNENLGFMRWHKGSKERSLRYIHSDVFYQPNESRDSGHRKRFHPVEHCWSSDGQIYVTFDTGSDIALYDFATGHGRLVSTDISDRNPDIQGNLTAIALAKGNIIVGGKDGMCRWLHIQNNYSSTRLQKLAHNLRSFQFTPNFSHVLFLTNDNLLSASSLHSEVIQELVTSRSGQYIAVDTLKRIDTFVVAEDTGTVRFWNAGKFEEIYNFDFQRKISTIACSPFTNLVAVGCADGTVILFYYNQQNGGRVIFKEKLHNTAINLLKFSPSGLYLATATADDRIYVASVSEAPRVLGSLAVTGPISGLTWNNTKTTGSMKLCLYILTRQDDMESIYRFDVLEDELASATPNSLDYAKSKVFRIREHLSGIAMVQNADVETSEAMYCITLDRQLKLYELPDGGDTVEITQRPLLQAESHSKDGGQILLSFHSDWLISWSTDGFLHLHSLPLVDKPLKIYAHDPFQGGVVSLATSRDCKHICSIGNDGIIRFWTWKHSVSGLKVANASIQEFEEEYFKSLDYISKADHRLEAISEVTLSHEGRNDISDPGFGTSPLVDSTKSLSRIAEERLVKIQQLSNQLLTIITQNREKSDEEKLTDEDLIVDHEEKEHLLLEAQEQVHKVREESDEQNIIRKIIQRRLRHEFWESMECVGQDIHAFRRDQATGQLYVVANYPIRKRSNAQKSELEKIKLIRKMQLAAQSIEKRSTPLPIHDSSIQSLMFNHFELTTKERKRMQAVLIAELIYEVKMCYNQKFKEFAKLKQEEVSKIFDKNDRIKAILSELQAQEEIFYPSLHPTEDPERIIKVSAEEIKAPKMMSEDEKRRLAEAKRAEEERARLAQSDNSRQRAVQHMMGGKLDDKSERTKTEEIIRPACIDKLPNELTEDEKKAIKEYQKKLAALNDEQEKYRKALEAEYKKLQNTVFEICAAFDDQLRQFFRLKMQTDEFILENELRIFKLSQSITVTEQIEIKISETLRQIELLKPEKESCIQDIAEIKKTLDSRREELERASKREKEMERQFKKEFQGHEKFDALYKLFKRREINNTPLQSTSNHSIHNPYTEIKPGAYVGAEVIPELDMKVDLPPDITMDLWNKLVEYRQKKIIAEAEVQVASQKFSDTQAIIQSITAHADALKAKTEAATSELTRLTESHDLTMYDVENLYQLKQGQVEVPQAPVVTDYSKAIFIHRNVIEDLNEQILARGKVKIEALTEIKNFRKGIHALEWENKMFDFQSEDLVIRIRDIQLLRVTKQMQEYIRSGNDNKQSAELASLEKLVEHGAESHAHKISEKQKMVKSLKDKIRVKVRENEELDLKLRDLEAAVEERQKIQDAHVAKEATMAKTEQTLKDIVARRKLVDLAKSQSREIEMLRTEVERLRLKTFPAFPSKGLSK